MPRWNPDAEQRLVTAAVELFGRDGYASVTINDIAERACLTRRSFFRYFSDKREVLFAGSEARTHEIAALVADLDAEADAGEAVLRALTEVGAFLLRDPAAQARRQDLIDTSSELQERERTKLASIADALADGLVARGVPREDAVDFGAVGAAVFHSAYVRTVRDPAGLGFEDRLRATWQAIGRFATA